MAIVSFLLGSLRTAGLLSKLIVKSVSTMPRENHSLNEEQVRRAAHFRPPMMTWIALIVALVTLLPIVTRSQIQNGKVYGTVVDQSSAAISGVRVFLHDPISGYHTSGQTDSKGEFRFDDLPFSNYAVRTDIQGFEPAAKNVQVASNVPVVLSISVFPGSVTAVVEVTDDEVTVGGSSSSTEILISNNKINREANLVRSRGLQRVVASAGGFATQNNGLMHIRGVEDGLLYVVDGVPTSDRIDTISAGAFDLDDVRSLNVITGDFPAEFGGRNAGVVIVQPNAAAENDSSSGTISAGLGNFRSGDIVGSFSRTLGKRFGFMVSGASSSTDRYLDPVDEQNFNNRGKRHGLNLRGDWRPATRDTVRFNFAIGRTDFRVPNDAIQHENGQAQRQRLKDNSQSISWERVWDAKTVTNVAWFRRFYSSELYASEFDTPISASQDRHHSRDGGVVSLTRLIKGHTIKAGGEFSRTAPREFFTFFITDEDLADDREVSEEAQEFTAELPFVFSDRRVGNYIAGYVQDSFSPIPNLFLNLGLRFEHSSLPISDYQFSPRFGARYFVERTQTAFRVSYNRLYQPPQIENLLLANSDQARQLSPFATETSGGATIRPETVAAFEVGITQAFWKRVRLDIAHWRRTFRNFGDPNTFFNTTIVFPNSVSRGFANGFDVRLDVPSYRGFSSYAAYTNSRIVQFGPINGGLFLTEEFLEIGEGTRFVPDHDQRNTLVFGAIYEHARSGFWASIGGRYESGVPLEVDNERLDLLREMPGADLVNFERQRIRPWTIFDVSFGIDLLRKEKTKLKLGFDVQNLANRRFAYNFGSPFEGTHFGHPRLIKGELRLEFK
jgi:hypothetical protein